MKTLFFACTLLVLCACGSKKKTAGSAENTEEATLRVRLEEFLAVNDKMDLEKVMDYTYPKLFTLAPRETVMKTMEEAFNNDEVKVQLDSLKIDTVYAIFQSGKGSYAKVNYSMLMLMDFKNSGDSTGNEQNEMIREGMAAQYGQENVRVDENGIIRIKVSSPMVAAKDEHSKDWTFVNLKEGDGITEKLFSKEVLDKLATYK